MDRTAAAYLRVSTGHQAPDNQRREIREYCQAKGINLVREYTDYDSAGSSQRPEFQAMLKAITRQRTGGWKTLVFWSLDRLSREGVLETLQYLQLFDRAGIQFVSVKEQYLDTTGPFGPVAVAILAALAQQERRRISERVQAGLQRARLDGVKLGRPRVELPPAAELAAERDAQTLSIPALAAKYQVSVNTIRRRLQQEGSPSHADL